MDASDHDEKNVQRIATLEANYHTLSRTVEEGFNDIRDTLRRLAYDINKQQRPNYMVWIAALGVSFTLFAGLYALISRPIAVQLNGVQTQIDSDAQMRNLQFTGQERINAILWNATPLGKVTPFPGGPYFEPNVSKESR